ncbi:CRISPR-associated endonuclease Cas1 [Laspinema olomoucense]|uniref:CRISPR-associated endonuclease Cas1 n=1 Tax=Laspinema olomoucense D3b TaxID=2953688 RepID=A0ABT2N9I8_9CYAN|nr:CRISPR-associated endonuclease Cas1 [Laspinema sp. D3b]MCT7979359.1 CRISPR-associated endonuclease Cas1 [Laspinema sp. D3b]
MNQTLWTQFLDPLNFQSAWQKVAENQGCAGVDRETITSFASHCQRNLAQLRQNLAQGTYRPLPLLQFFIPKPDRSWRSLAVPTLRDRIVQQALLQVLYPQIEPHFEPCSFAYRPGRSHLQAVRQVAYWRDRDYDWVLDADIIQYFENVQHPRLLAEVAERLNLPWVLSLIDSWLNAGILTNAGLILPEKGLPQGATISPILANIYLDDFDEIISHSGLKLVRYADDFVVMARSQKQIIAAQQEISQILDGIGLQLHPQKTQITNFHHGFRFLGQAFAGDLIVPINPPVEPQVTPRPASNLRLVHAETLPQPTFTPLPLPRGEGQGSGVRFSGMNEALPMKQALLAALKAEKRPIPPPLFVVLGYAVREEKSIPITSDELIWKPDMSTLYLVEQGAVLTKEQSQFRVKPPQGQTVEIPIREVDRILIFGNIQISTAAIGVCLNSQIPLIFLSQLGQYKGHLWPAELCDIKALSAQFHWEEDAGFQMETARAIVQGKLRNSKNYLLKLNRKRSSPQVLEAITGITRDLIAIENTHLTLDELRGYEGVAATRYFQALGQLITNPGFTFTERNRRPPKDPVNSLLSFGYTLLFNNVLSLILAEGLNLYIGNLHRSEKKEPRLAFDLMEEFRSPIVDTLMIKLVNQKILRPTDFTWPNPEGGIYLTDSGRRVFLKHFEDRISLKISHPDIKDKVSYRRVIQLQVQRYKKALLQGIPYESFIRVD